ncbi:MAG TPA: hypothetical protein VII95_19640 [Terriglobales bacterium]|jgi:hypothetical protein
MTDWKDKLEQEYRAKRKSAEDEAQRRQNHDQFIQSEGWSAWQDLTRKIGDACQHLSTRANASLTFMPTSQDEFTIAGGTEPLDLSLDVPTRKVIWHLRETGTQGMLRPDRQRDQLVYPDNGNVFASMEDAAGFLLRKVF